MKRELTDVTREGQQGSRRTVLYMAAPLSPTELEFVLVGGDPDHALLDNLDRAERWLAWLRRSFPDVTIIAPWIASVRASADDTNPATRERGLIDDCAVVERCDGIVLVGGRISSGMARERATAEDAGLDVVDLTALGAEPPAAGERVTVPAILTGGAR